MFKIYIYEYINIGSLRKKLSQLPDSEMSSQKGESNSYWAFMIFEKRRVSDSS